MWWRRRKAEEAMRDAVRAALDEARRELAKTVKEAQTQSLQEALLKVLPEMLEKSMSSARASVEMTTSLAQAVGDLSVRRFAALLGSRGGHRTQERRRLKNITPDGARADCAVCKNPYSQDLEAIRRHVAERHTGFMYGTSAPAQAVAQASNGDGSQPAQGAQEAPAS